MDTTLWFLACPAYGVLAGLAVVAAGGRQDAAFVFGLLAAGAAFAGLVSGLYTVLSVCSENSTYDVGEPFSPRRRYCDEDSFTSQLALWLALIPPAFAALGGVLRARGRPRLGWSVAALSSLAIAVPPVYVETLSTTSSF